MTVSARMSLRAARKLIEPERSTPSCLVSVYLFCLLLTGGSASAAPITIERNLQYALSLAPVNGTFGSGQTLSGVSTFFSADPFTFNVGDTLILNILFDRRLEVFDFGSPTLEYFSFGLDNGVGSPNSFSGTWTSSIEALGGNGNIWSGQLTLSSQGGGGGFGWGGQGINLTDSQGSFTGIRWVTQLTGATQGAPLTLSAFTGVQMGADGINVAPLSPVPEPTSLVLVGTGIALLVKSNRKRTF